MSHEDHIPFWTFNQLIKRTNIPLEQSRLVRHDQTISNYYFAKYAMFMHHTAHQAAGIDPYARARFVFQFLPHRSLANGDHQALFVAAYEILGGWKCDQDNRMSIHCIKQELTDTVHTAYDLKRVSAFDSYSERLVVNWGRSTRSWSQWADRQAKEITELRARKRAVAFPGFDRFETTMDDLQMLPEHWQSVLQNTAGVYLLVCPETGEQYVGSAYGRQGFLERWRSYALNGHGGNLLLAQRKRRNMAIKVLEVCGSNLTEAEIIARESLWKQKLGTRSHGLNAN